MSRLVFQEPNLGCTPSNEDIRTCNVCLAHLPRSSAIAMGTDTVDQMYELNTGACISAICPKCMVRLHKYLGDQLLDYYRRGDADD